MGGGPGRREWSWSRPEYLRWSVGHSYSATDEHLAPIVLVVLWRSSEIVTITPSLSFLKIAMSIRLPVPVVTRNTVKSPCASIWGCTGAAPAYAILSTPLRLVIENATPSS